MSQATRELPFAKEGRLKSVSCASRVLAVLQKGPASSWDLIEAAGHRFSTGVCSLREQGYDIETVEVDGGEFLHILRGYVDRVKVTPEMQAAYYETEHWKERRGERLRKDFFACCLCRSVVNLQVHHWRYDLFAEQMRDLSTMCRECHEFIHENPNVRIHFPRYVAPDIAERLKPARPV